MTENITKKRQPSCDKCFHYGICPTWDSWNDKSYADGYSDGCQKYSNFKDKSRIIELPCEVGTDEHFGKTVFLTREDAEKAMVNNKEKESDR